MILRRRHKRKAARIEMVPLIDIVFLLLVFFIYAMLSMAVHRGMKVDLPESASPEFSEKIPLSVSVQIRSGMAVIFIDKVKVSLEELENQLRIRSSEMNQENEVMIFLKRK